jgi:ribosome biogenesis GTPase
MARRKLNRRQQSRIREAQQAIDPDDPSNHRGLVISHRGKAIEVEPLDTRGDNIACGFKPSLGAIVCGDRVIYRDAGRGPLIVAIQPRKNLLQRMDGFGHVKAVAANVTQLVVCLAVEPEPNLFLLDQYLLSAEQQGLRALILLNKTDLLDARDDDPFSLRAIYEPLGYEVLHSSIGDPASIRRLLERLKGQTSVISGVSGVGKSSLTKAILPEIEIRIAEISEYNREGRHTTRSSRLYHLPGGGDLIDTPGVRGFNPVLDHNQPLADGFREIRDAAQHCRFANCRHVNEPGCAVRTAVDAGRIHPARYAHYLKLLESLDAE